MKSLGLKDAARGVGGRLTDLAGSIVLMHNDVASPRGPSSAAGASTPAKYIMRMVLAVRSVADSYEVIVGGGVSVKHSSIADVTLQKVKDELGTDADVLDDFIESLTSASLPCFLSIQQVGVAAPRAMATCNYLFPCVATTSTALDHRRVRAPTSLVLYGRDLGQ